METIKKFFRQENKILGMIASIELLKGQRSVVFPTPISAFSLRGSASTTPPRPQVRIRPGVVIRVNIEFRVGAEREWGWIPGLRRRRMSSRSGRSGWRLVVGSPICANAGNAAGYCAPSHPPFRSSLGESPDYVPIAAVFKAGALLP